MWYVIVDEDGPFLTEDKPEDESQIVFQSEDQAEAEAALCRECNGWEDEHDDMNEDFQ